MPDWPSFLREFGLPITMLSIVLVAGGMGWYRWGRQVDAERERSDKAWQERLDDWKARWTDEHTGRVASEQRLADILPAIAAFTTLAADIREELRRVDRRRDPGR